MLEGTSWTDCSRRVAVTSTSSMRVTCGSVSCAAATCDCSAIAIPTASGERQTETSLLRTCTPLRPHPGTPTLLQAVSRNKSVFCQASIGESE